jgi:hypothetical protein
MPESNTPILDALILKKPVPSPTVPFSVLPSATPSLDKLMGFPTPGAVEEPNLLQRGLEVIGRPAAASAGFAYGLASGQDPFALAGKGLSGEQRYNYADVLGKMGVPEGVLRNVAGFIGDVVLDPTMWIPGIGVVSAAKVGGKVGVGLRAVEKAQALPFELIGKGISAAFPTAKLVTPEIPRILGIIETQTANQGTRLGQVGAKLREIPGAKAILDRITGPTQFAGDIQGSLERVAKGANAFHAGQQSFVASVTAPIRAIRSPYQVVDQDGVRLVTNVAAKKTGASMALGDIMEHPTWYNLTPEQLAYRDQAVATSKSLWEYGKSQGLDLTDLGMEAGDVFPRYVLGRAADGSVEVVATRKTGRAVGAAENQLKKHRFYESQLEGMKTGLIYEEDAGAILGRLAGNIYRGAGDNQLRDIVKGMVEGIRSPKPPALLKQNVEDAKTFYDSLTMFEQAIQRTRRGEILPPPLVAALKDKFPTMGQDLEELVKLSKANRARTARLATGQQELTMMGKVTRVVDPEDVRVLQDERQALEQVLNEAYAERDVLKEMLANDPVANYTWPETYTRSVGGVLKTYTRILGLDSIIPKSRAFKGQWPESITQKQALNLMMGKKPSPSSIRPDGRVKWEYVMDQLTEHFGMQSEDELIAAIEKLAEQKAQLADLPNHIKAMEGRLSELTGLADKVGPPAPIEPPIPPLGNVPASAGGIPPVPPTGPRLTQLLQDVRETKASTKGMLAEARKQAKLGRERTAFPKVGEEVWLTPRAFGGSIAPREAGEAINRLFGPQQTNGALQGLSNVANAIRMLQTGFDLGAGTLQLLPTMFRNPGIWAKAMKNGMDALTDPTALARFQVEHAATYEKFAPHGLLAGGAHEVTDPLRQAGGIGRVFQEGPLSKVAIPAGRAFESQLETARVMILEGLDAKVEREVQKLVAGGLPLDMAQRQVYGDLAGFSNKITGVLNTQALGLSATQRQLESAALLYSPRYTRAAFALLGDIANGGLAGREAMKSLGALMAGGITTYTVLANKLHQEPNLDPRDSKFLTVKLGDTYVGPGSIWVAMARAAGNMAKAVANPSDFAVGGALAGKQDWKDMLATDPFWKFWRGRTAPFTGNFLDILNNETMVGDPVNSLEDIMRVVVARDLAPFWLSEIVQPGPEAGLIEQPIKPEDRLANLAAGLSGLRAWPVSEAETRNNLRDKYSKVTYGKEWNGLTRPEKDVLEQAHDDLRAATQTAQIEIERRGGPMAIYGGLTKQIENTKLVRGQELDRAAGAVLTGKMTYEDYNNVREEAMTKYGIQTEMLYNQREAAAKDVPQFQQKDLERTAELDARDRYYQISLDSFRDDTGQLNDDSWVAFENAQKTFLDTLTPDLRKYVVAHESDWIQALPKAARQIETQRQKDYALLEQYWKIADDVWQSVPTLAALRKRIDLERDPMTADALRKMSGMSMVDKQISLRKEALRYSSPAVDAALYRWGYVSKPILMRA